MNNKECYICSCKNCEVVIGGAYTKGERLVCPNYVKNSELHELLKTKVEQRDSLQLEIDLLRGGF